jgi:proline iminopeptidase
MRVLHLAAIRSKDQFTSFKPRKTSYLINSLFNETSLLAIGEHLYTMNVPPGQRPVSGYAHTEAFDSGFLAVGEIHQLHYEQYGKKDGKPGKEPFHPTPAVTSNSRSTSPPHSPHHSPPTHLVIFLHGGPGGSTSLASTVFFSPSIYRVVLLDQRGAGKSLPPASLVDNTSHHLVSDIETLRRHLQIEKWQLVFGGSWGSTLALLYAQTHPEVVGSLVLRGIFTMRRKELEWFYGQEGGIRNVFPEEHEEFLNFLPEGEQGDPIKAYYELMTGEDEKVRLEAARAWSGFELATSSLLVGEGALKKLEDDGWALAHSRIEAHYFVHGAWLGEGQLLGRESIERVRHIPSEWEDGWLDCEAIY